MHWYTDHDGEFELRNLLGGWLIDTVAGRDAAIERASQETRHGAVELRQHGTSVLVVTPSGTIRPPLHYVGDDDDD